MPAPTRCSKRLMKAQKCCALMASAPGTTWPFPLLPSKCSSFQPHGQESTLPWPSGMTSSRYAGQACTCWLVTATVPVPNGVSQYWRHTLAVITAAASVHDTVNAPSTQRTAAFPQCPQLWNKLEAISATVDPIQPWTAPNASMLDATTVATWLDANARTDMGRWSIAAICRMGGSGAFEPSQTSMLHLAWTQRISPQSEVPEVRVRNTHSLTTEASVLVINPSPGAFLHQPPYSSVPISL
jgi:hypothetical protein